jgi:hypothetical protein
MYLSRRDESVEKGRRRREKSLNRKWEETKIEERES